MLVNIRDASRGFFQLIDSVWATGHTADTIHRICTMMRLMGAKTRVLEELDTDDREWPRINKEIEAVRKRTNQKITAKVTKVSFIFTAVPEDKPEELGRLSPDEILGYAIIITLELTNQIKCCYVFESVVRELGTPFGKPPTWQPIDNYYLHARQTLPVRINKEHEYRIPATYFCQQNGITNVCAHACAIMILNTMRRIEKDSDILTCEDVNAVLGIDHVARMQRIPDSWGNNDMCTHDGLSWTELTKLFRHYGLAVREGDFSGEQRKNFRAFLYGFIESGFPALLCFNVPDLETHSIIQHVVAVVGHTLSPHSWFPTAFANYVGKGSDDRGWLSSLDWVNDFLVHDDNFGMQLCLPAHSFKSEEHPDAGLSFVPIAGLAVFPPALKTTMLSFQAEKMAFSRLIDLLITLRDPSILGLMPYYVQHLVNNIAHGGTPVMRTLMVTKGQYLAHIAKPDHHGTSLSKDQLYAISGLLSKYEHFWLVEASEPDLFVGNSTKIIDVLLDPISDETQEEGTSGVILIRMPGQLFAPADAEQYELVCTLNTESHHPLYQ